ncbi:MAG: PilZ domain-containing protein [Acidobacteriota bacterium]
MSSQVLDRSNICLQKGWVVAISQLTDFAERVARVTKSSPGKTGLKLSRGDSPTPFQQGETVRIKYWDELAVSYWEGKVLKIAGKNDQQVTISDQSEGITLGRRRYSRLSLGIPISFKVIHTTSEVIQPHTCYSDQIQDMSAGGLSIDSNLQLEVGDELEVELDLPHSKKLCVGGWVVRSTANESGQEDRHSIAMEFLGLGSEESEQLQKFLDRYQVGAGAYKITGLYPALPLPANTVQRREERRFEIELTGTAVLRGAEGEMKQSITTRDLCASGGYFLSDSSPWVGDQVKIRLQWPSQAEQPDTTFEILGKVLRVEQETINTCGFAVEFQEIIDLDVM